jgi:hypothetical protein
VVLVALNISDLTVLHVDVNAATTRAHVTCGVADLVADFWRGVELWLVMLGHIVDHPPVKLGAFFAHLILLWCKQGWPYFQSAYCIGPACLAEPLAGNIFKHANLCNYNYKYNMCQITAQIFGFLIVDKGEG